MLIGGLTGVPGPLDLGDSAPWWASLGLALVALLAPLIVPRVLDRLGARRDTARRAGGGAAADQDDDAGDDDPPDDPPEVRELRDTLISVLTKLQRVEARAEQLETSLSSRTDELARERAQTTALTKEVSALRTEVDRLRALVEGLAQR